MERAPPGQCITSTRLPMAVDNLCAAKGQEANGDVHQQAGITKEMMQPLSLHLHLVSLAGRAPRAVYPFDRTAVLFAAHP